MQAYACPVAAPSLEIAALPLAGHHPAEPEGRERRARLLAVGALVIPGGQLLVGVDVDFAKRS